MPSYESWEIEADEDVTRWLYTAGGAMLVWLGLRRSFLIVNAHANRRRPLLCFASLTFASSVQETDHEQIGKQTQRVLAREQLRRRLFLIATHTLGLLVIAWTPSGAGGGR